MSGELPPGALRKLLAAGEPLLDELREGALHAGRYRLIRELGRGGMGVVWEAEDVELRRRVALKMLSQPLATDDEARRRFLREAQAVARLNHPGIATVYEADERCIAMQLIAGVPLSLYPRDDVRRLVTFARDAARAVHHAHQRGVIHRDLKPSNLMIEGDRIVVTDFGLAKETSLDSSLSLSGSIVGTPAYMASEQAEGRVRDVDPRTDVYGLGATLYDLLAGRPPFVDRDMYRLLRKVVEEEPAPLRAIRNELPRDLDTVVLKCLAKERERRYQSAAELADDLDRWLGSEAVLARPPSLRYRLGKFLLRRRAVMVASSVGAIAVAVALFVLAAEQRKAKQAFQLAESIHTIFQNAQTHRREGDEARVRAEVAAGIAACQAFLEDSDVGYVHYLLARLQRTLDQSDAAKEALDRAIERDPLLSEARFERGLLQAERFFERLAEEVPAAHRGSSGDLPVELESLRAHALADLAAGLAAGDRLRHVDGIFGTAEQARLRGDLAAARRGYEEVLRLDPLHIDARLAKVQLELSEDRGDDALHLAMSAVDIYRGFGPAYLVNPSPTAERESEPAAAIDEVVRRHRLTRAEQAILEGDTSAEALQERAAARLRIEDIEGALTDFTAALQANPSDALAHANRGGVHARQAARLGAAGSLDPALQAWEAAIQDYSNALVLDEHLAGALCNRGVCHFERERILRQQGHVAAAEEAHAAAERDFSAAIERAPRFALAYFNRGLAHRQAAERLVRRRPLDAATAQITAALADLDAAVALRPADADTRVERSRALSLEARIAFAEERSSRAERAAVLAREDLEVALGEEPGHARALGYRGMVRLEEGDARGAVQDLERALALALDSRTRLRFEAELARARESWR